MKLFFLPILALAAFGQTPPAPQAVNNLTVGNDTCLIELQDNAGAVFVQCKKVADGTISLTRVWTIDENGGIFTQGNIGCLYDKKADGAFWMQCGDTQKIILEGNFPSITPKKRRWYLLWR